MSERAATTERSVDVLSKCEMEARRAVEVDCLVQVALTGMISRVKKLGHCAPSHSKRCHMA